MSFEHSCSSVLFVFQTSVCSSSAPFLQIILVLAVILLALTNLIATLLDVSRRPVDSGSRMTNALRSNGSTDGWPRDGVATKYISIEVLSSKDHVKVSVDDATVILPAYFICLTSSVEPYCINPLLVTLLL